MTLGTLKPDSDYLQNYQPLHQLKHLNFILPDCDMPVNFNLALNLQELTLGSAMTAIATDAEVLSAQLRSLVIACKLGWR